MCGGVSVSGPVDASDAQPDVADCGHAQAPTVEVLESRATTVGGVEVRRALPRRRRRTVGAWCFADHFGPTSADGPAHRMQVKPHPQIGLQTVTWLVEGEVVRVGARHCPVRPRRLAPRSHPGAPAELARPRVASAARPLPLRSGVHPSRVQQRMPAGTRLARRHPLASARAGDGPGRRGGAGGHRRLRLGSGCRRRRRWGRDRRRAFRTGIRGWDRRRRRRNR